MNDVSKNPKVLMMSAYFPPENGSASHLFYELGKVLVERGNAVRMLTGFPGYHVDKQTLPARYRKWLLTEAVDGIIVHRIRRWVLPRRIHALRAIDEFVAAFTFFLRGLFINRKDFDCILVYSPPLPLGLAAFALGALKMRPYIFNVQDLFPQDTIDLGALKSRFIIAVYEAIERFIYRHAGFLTVHSEGNRDHVLTKDARVRKTLVVHNWVDTDHIRPGERLNKFREEQGLHDKWIVSFAGVMGPLQDLKTVLHAARTLKAHTDIHFVLVGDGSTKTGLMELAEKLGLKNVRFLGMMPRQRYPELLHASDLCLVPLSPVLKSQVPSKILSIMSAARPIVGSMRLDGEAAQVIREAQAGLCVEPKNADALAAAILKCHQNRDEAEAMGKNGRVYLERHFALDVCCKIYEDLFRRVST